VYVGRRAASSRAVSVFFVPEPITLAVPGCGEVRLVRFGLSAAHADFPRIGYTVPLYAAAVERVAAWQAGSGLDHRIWGLAGQPVIMHAVWRHLAEVSPGPDGIARPDATAIAWEVVRRYGLAVISGDPFRVTNADSAVRLRDDAVARIPDGGKEHVVFAGLDYATCDAVLYIARVGATLPTHHVRRTRDDTAFVAGGDS
jgi:hypothetical protein